MGVGSRASPAHRGPGGEGVVRAQGVAGGKSGGEEGRGGRGEAEEERKSPMATPRGGRDGARRDWVGRRRGGRAWPLSSGAEDYWPQGARSPPTLAEEAGAAARARGRGRRAGGGAGARLRRAGR